jgi:arylsulfatase/arylsulfatase A
MAADPYEQHDVAAAHPEVVARLKEAYSAWFDDVSGTRGYDPPRIHVGSPRERITTLTRQDWRGPEGHWEIEIERAVRARVTVTLPPALGAGVAHLKVGRATWQQRVDAPATECVFEAVDLVLGPRRLQAWLSQGSGNFQAWSVEVKTLD